MKYETRRPSRVTSGGTSVLGEDGRPGDDEHGLEHECGAGHDRHDEVHGTGAGGGHPASLGAGLPLPWRFGAPAAQVRHRQTHDGPMTADAKSPVARIERRALCDTLVELGPDAPTLCDPWRTRDLAAHLVVRERRPDAAAGIWLHALAGHTERVQTALAQGDWDRLVETIRTGPPLWSPARLDRIDAIVNTVELVVHHEDALRGDGAVGPRREVPERTSRAVHAALRKSATLMFRRSPVGVRLVAPGRDPVMAGPEVAAGARGRGERKADPGRHRHRRAGGAAAHRLRPDARRRRRARGRPRRHRGPARRPPRRLLTPPAHVPTFPLDPGTATFARGHFGGKGQVPVSSRAGSSVSGPAGRRRAARP